MCSCAQFIVKYVLFIANLLFSLAGICLIALGIATLVSFGKISDVIPSIVSAIPITVIVLGSIIFVIAFFGCCGAIRESRCLLIMYAVCMAILIGGKIYLTVVIFRSLASIQTTVAGWVNSAFNPDESSTFQGFDALQLAFSCCGTTGPSSYGNYTLPASCCGATSGNCVENVYDDGCIDKLSGYFETFGDAIGAVLIVVIIFEAVAMIFSLCLCCGVTRKLRRVV